jgi:RecA-family ATPase
MNNETNGIGDKKSLAPQRNEAEQSSNKQYKSTTKAASKQEETPSTEKKDIDEILEGYDCNWLLANDIPPTKFVIEEILPVGYSVLGGRPKQGKSLSVLGSMALPIATGRKAFGIHDVQQGTVLLFDFEGHKRRMKERLERFIADDEQAQNLAQMHVYHNFPRAHEKGLDLLQVLLDKYTDTALVVIDTLPRFAPPKEQGQNEYDSEYNLGASLFKLAHERQIAILSIIHTTKGNYSNVFDNLRGSGGTAAADVLMVLERTNDKYTKVLHSTGRDIEEMKFELQLDNDTLLYRSIGECEDERYSELTNFEFKSQIPDAERKQQKEQAIALREQGKSIRDIAQMLGISKSTVERMTKSTVSVQP